MFTVLQPNSRKQEEVKLTEKEAKSRRDKNITIAASFSQ